MQDDKMVCMELKYCECCGGLLLRRTGTGATYCSGCALRVRELAPPRGKRRGRPPKKQAGVVVAIEPAGTNGEVAEEPQIPESAGLDIQAVSAPRMLPSFASIGVAEQPGRTA